MINKANVFNTALPAANTNLLSAVIKPSFDPGKLLIYICSSIAGVLTLRRTSGGVTVSEVLNSGVALVAGAAYEFTIQWKAGDSINLQLSTPSIAGSTCTNNTGVATGSPITLVMGNNVITVTGAGTFDIALPAGITGTATSGTATLVGSPVALPAGMVTTVDTGATIGNFTINITGGTLIKLQADEEG